MGEGRPREYLLSTTSLHLPHPTLHTLSIGGANPYLGIDGHRGVLTDMVAAGVLDPFAVRAQVIKSAVEAACMLLRIDDVLSGMKNKKYGDERPAPNMEEGGEEGGE